MTEDVFRFKTPNVRKCKLYGFREEGGALLYETEILDGQFLLRVEIAEGKVTTSLTDTATDEPYTLHLVEEAAGAFVGSVREAYTAKLAEIAQRCCDFEIFREEQTRRLIAHIADIYGDAPEYLWEKFPDNAAVRRRDNGKWYAAILTAERKKLGAAGEGKAELLDVRIDPAELDLPVDGKTYFRGYHMNKKHWLTVILDDSLPDEEVFALLEESYHLAAKQK